MCLDDCIQDPLEGEMMTDLQHIADLLADVIWWLKGYMAAADDDDSIFGFNEEHIIAVRESRIKILKEINSSEGDNAVSNP